MRSAHLRAAAERDVEAAIGYYRDEGGPDVALAFVDAFEAAVGTIRAHPLIGSLRFAYELEIPDLRSWSLERFPFLVFSVPDDDAIDIWRVLHERRDLPADLQADPPA